MLFCISEIQKGGKMLLSVKKRYTLTIPKSIREKLHVKEGEYIEAEVNLTSAQFSQKQTF
ncbi:MAG: AbrB/MazE/SpoVT family DNA-binding domain-containing protein [Nitrospirota bacterium]